MAMISQGHMKSATSPAGQVREDMEISTSRMCICVYNCHMEEKTSLYLDAELLPLFEG